MLTWIHGGDVCAERTVNVTCTAILLDPMLKLICPVYVPGSRFALDTATMTSWRPPLDKVPPDESIPNHCPPLPVDTEADHVPESPQLLIVTL